MFIDKFVATGAGGLSHPAGIAFGPDGNFYVADFRDPSDQVKSNVLRFDGTSGEYIDVFIPAGYGGLGRPAGIKFGPDGNLFIVDLPNNGLLRYDGNTGDFLDAFVSSNQGSLDRPTRVLFNQNELLITSRFSDEVMRFTVPSWAVFNVTLSSPSSETVLVDYQAIGDTAIAGEDFTATSGTLTFAPGETIKTVFVPMLNDETPEFSETFTVTLSNAVGAPIMPGADTGTATILDDDAAGDPNALYVWDIEFNSRLRGKNGSRHDEQIIINVRRDSDGDGVAEESDEVVVGAVVDVQLTGPDGFSAFSSNTTDSAGNRITGWYSSLADGTYHCRSRRHTGVRHDVVG